MELIAPVVMILISGTYFLAAPKEQPLKVRLLASAHGFTASLIFLTAMIIGIYRAQNPEFGMAYLVAFLLPTALIVYSFIKFGGNKAIHLLQLINIPVMLLAIFVGFLAITGIYI